MNELNGPSERAQPDHPQPPAEAPAPPPSSKERVWATFCHLAALIPLPRIRLGFILGPLVVWLIKKDESPFVNRHGKAALNFQISMILYGALLIGFGFVCLTAVLNADRGRFSGEQLIVGPWRLDAALVTPLFLLIASLALFDLVCVIVGAVRANKGREYRYPLAIPFIR